MPRHFLQNTFFRHQVQTGWIILAESGEGPNSDVYNQFTALLLRSQDPVSIGHGHGSSWNTAGCEQEKRKEEGGGKGLKSEPVQWLVHTCTHKHTQSHMHTYLVLLAYNQPTKGVFPLPEEIRVPPETNSGTKISFPFAQWICGAIPGRPQKRGLPKRQGNCIHPEEENQP